MPDTPAAVDNPVATKVSLQVRRYIACREEIKRRKEEFEKSLKPYIELQEFLTGWLQDFMETAGADNIKTPHGTCYASTKHSASLADPDAFMKFVISNAAYDLIDRKANVTACRDYTEANGAPPPGVNLSSIKTVGVRRAAGT